MTDDKRRHQRIDVSKLAFAREGGQAHGGLLRDISPGGAFIEFRYPLGRVEHDFETGDSIEVLLDDETVLNGTAVRVLETGIALAFNLENTDQRAAVEALIAADG